MSDLSDIISRLLHANVDFVIVGGLAAVTHGSSMTTQDIDICCSFSADNLMKLYEALKDFHPVHRMTPKRVPLVLTPEYCKKLKNLYLDTDLGQLDCLGEVLGVGIFSQVKALSDEFVIGDVPCRILSIEALIKAKKAMGRPKDLETVRQLELIKRQNDDTPEEND